MRAVTDDPEWEACMRQFDERMMDLKAANECVETLPHHATPGLCVAPASRDAGRRRRWCSKRCESEWAGQHYWNAARNNAKRRDGQQCVRPGCGVTTGLEVNHIEPRIGRGYGWGCHNHLANLETLCKPHHQDVTNEQRKGRRAVGHIAAPVDDNQGGLW